MADTGTDRRKASANRKAVGTQAKKRMAAPLLAAKMPHATIAGLLKVSVRTVARWAGDDEVKADIAGVTERARAAGEERIEAIVRKAFDALEEALTSDDDRVKLEAAKTAFDRFGHPVTAKSELSGPGGGPIEQNMRAVLIPGPVAHELASDASGNEARALPRGEDGEG